MNAYLYTWNPNLWTWNDQQIAIHSVNNGEQYDMYWSCGNTKRIAIGDQFFLIRLGVEPKGIIACGYISSTPYLLPHWNIEKEQLGKQALRTDLLFKALSDTPIISLSFLQDKYPNYSWTPQMSGISIPEDIAKELFNLIQGNAGTCFQPSTENEIKLYVEGKSKVLTVQSYDRNADARQACIEYYGYDCTVCGFNFEKSYGTRGKKYIEVHHLKQIADIGKEYFIDPIRDLRPVCANCHRMLHKTRPPISIEELQNLRKHITSCKTNTLL